jgi:hypothetical protein
MHLWVDFLTKGYYKSEYETITYFRVAKIFNEVGDKGIDFILHL